MDPDKLIPGFLELIKSPLLLLALVGLGLCLVAGLGTWPGSQSAPIELPWRLGFGIIGIVVAAPNMVLFVRQVVRTSGPAIRKKIKIEGRYLAENLRTEPIEITYLQDNF